MEGCVLYSRTRYSTRYSNYTGVAWTSRNPTPTSARWRSRIITTICYGNWGEQSSMVPNGHRDVHSSVLGPELQRLVVLCYLKILHLLLNKIDCTFETMHQIIWIHITILQRLLYYFRFSSKLPFWYTSLIKVIRLRAKNTENEIEINFAILEGLRKPILAKINTVAKTIFALLPNAKSIYLHHVTSLKNMYHKVKC